MLFPIAFLNWFFKKKKIIYLVTITRKLGWIICKTDIFFCLWICKNFIKNTNLIINNYKLHLFIINNLLGGFFNFIQNFKILGTNYKINKYKYFFFFRNNVAHKTILFSTLNIKYFLIKKILFKTQSRSFNWTQKIFYLYRTVSNKYIYKKKGIFFKNEIVFIKAGKIVKN